MASVNWFEDGVSSWVLAIWIRFDEGLRLETSPLDSLYGVQLQYKLSWVKPNYFCNIPPLRRIETYYLSFNVSMNWDQVSSGGRGAVSILLAIMVRILYFKGYSALTYITHPWAQLFALSSASQSSVLFDISFQIAKISQCFALGINLHYNGSCLILLVHRLSETSKFLFLLQVLPGKSFCHSCSLIFLYAGQFMVSISCTETATEQTATSQQGTGSESPERTCNSENTEKALKGEIHGLKRSWTYSPSVKIRVVWWEPSKRNTLQLSTSN